MLSINGASSIPNIIPKRSNPAVAAKVPSKRLQSPSASNGPSNGGRATQKRDEVSISPQTRNILDQSLNSLNQQIKQQMLNSAGQQMRNVAKQIMQKDFNQENSDFNNFRKNADTANLAAANSLPQSILPLISGR